MPTRNKSKKPTLKERRREKRDAIASAVKAIALDLDKVRSEKEQADLLSSVAKGLYDELDKLTKKAPVDQVTDLVVSHVNFLIDDVRSLARKDPYVQRVTPFVPAGDNPEHRDVLLMLKAIRQGLDRFSKTLPQREKSVENRLGLANGLVVALTLYTDYNQTQITGNELRANGASLPSSWWTPGSIYGEDQTVDLSIIDTFDVELLLIKEE